MTLRDGGYLNRHSWTEAAAARVAEAVGRAGLPLIEVGYFTPAAGAAERPSASCPPAYLDALAAATTAGLVVMARPQSCPPAALPALARHGVAMVRLVTTVEDVAACAGHVAALREAGIAVSVNLTRASEQAPARLREAAAHAERLGADVVYLADSNGSMLPADVGGLYRTVSGGTGVALGFHAHNNLELAFANTLAALANGASYVDGSIRSIGKGGGNLRTELFVSYLKAGGAPGIDPWPLCDGTLPIEAECAALADGLPDARISALLNLNLNEISQYDSNGLRELFDGAGQLANHKRGLT
ncbi:hypothetical protein ACTG9Q_24265 [Actinokineospora sp. 24-640]